MRTPSVPTLPSDPGAGSLLTDAVRGWDRFWFGVQDPTTLCFIRICAGLVIFYVHLTYSWQLLSYVGPNAWVNDNVARYIRLDAPIFTQGANWEDNLEQDPIRKGNFYWSIYYHVTQPGWIIAIHVGILAAMLMLILGLGTRYAAALSWAGAMSYVHRANSTVFGLDSMMMIVLLYLLIGPSGAVLSLDRWLEKRKARQRGETPPEVKPSLSANLAVRLLQVHFCVIYFASGTSKLLGPTWWSGTSLSIVMLNPEFAPMNYGPYLHLMQFLVSHRWLWETFMAVSIVGTLVLEIGFPFLVWDLRWRWAVISGSVLLHSGIAVFMGLTTFSLIMICMVASFVPPEVVREQIALLAERLSGLLNRKSSTVANPRELVMTRN